MIVPFQTGIAVDSGIVFRDEEAIVSIDAVYLGRRVGIHYPNGIGYYGIEFVNSLACRLAWVSDDFNEGST